MAETTILLNDTSEVENRSLTVAEQAKSFIAIKDKESYIKAAELFKQINLLMKEVDEGFDKNIKRWHEGHKAAVADKARYWNPLNDAKKTIKISMERYDYEQEQVRLAEQRRLQEEARKREEEDRLQAAIEAEKEGDEEAAEEILVTPGHVAPVVVTKEVPKVSGGPTFRTVWQFEITDLGKIPREYLIADDVKIGAVVRALKDSCTIPGIRVYSKRV